MLNWLLSLNQTPHPCVVRTLSPKRIIRYNCHGCKHLQARPLKSRPHDEAVFTRAITQLLFYKVWNGIMLCCVPIPNINQLGHQGIENLGGQSWMMLCCPLASSIKDGMNMTLWSSSLNMSCETLFEMLLMSHFLSDEDCVSCASLTTVCVRSIIWIWLIAATQIHTTIFTNPFDALPLPNQCCMFNTIPEHAANTF